MLVGKQKEIHAARDRKLDENGEARSKIRAQASAARYANLTRPETRALACLYKHGQIEFELPFSVARSKLRSSSSGFFGLSLEAYYPENLLGIARKKERFADCLRVLNV